MINLAGHNVITLSSIHCKNNCSYETGLNPFYFVFVPDLLARRYYAIVDLRQAVSPFTLQKISNWEQFLRHKKMRNTQLHFRSFNFFLSPSFLYDIQPRLVSTFFWVNMVNRLLDYILNKEYRYSQT